MPYPPPSHNYHPSFAPVSALSHHPTNVPPPGAFPHVHASPAYFPDVNYHANYRALPPSSTPLYHTTGTPHHHGYLQPNPGFVDPPPVTSNPMASHLRSKSLLRDIIHLPPPLLHLLSPIILLMLLPPVNPILDHLLGFFRHHLRHMQTVVLI